MVKRQTKESKYLKRVDKIKNERLRSALIFCHFHMKEILFVLLLLAIVIQKKHLAKLPYVGKFFKDEPKIELKNKTVPGPKNHGGYGK